MRIVAIGDVGVREHMIHIGDEAMFEAMLRAVRARGVDSVTAISAVPGETAARYAVDAVEPIGFGAALALGRRAAEERLAAVIAAAHGGPAVDGAASAVIDAVRSADGVVVAGGGNLTSTWPVHVFERAALGGIAAAFGRPLVVTGQTLGPVLDADDAGLVAGLLRNARLVGVREADSLALAARLVPDTAVAATLDDAAFLDAENAPSVRAHPYCLVTVANHTGDLDREAALTGVAALLDHVAAATGLEIVFSAHWGSTLPGVVAGDDAVHVAIASRMRASSSVVPVTTSSASAALARGAAFVVSSRYHPAVFASAVGVPVLGVSVDEYTRVKLTGALANVGQESVVPMRLVAGGRAGRVVDAVWADRAAIRAAGAVALPARLAATDVWWDRVVAALS